MREKDGFVGEIPRYRMGLNDIWQREMRMPLFADSDSRPTMADKIVIFGGRGRCGNLTAPGVRIADESLWRSTPRGLWGGNFLTARPHRGADARGADRVDRPRSRAEYGAKGTWARGRNPMKSRDETWLLVILRRRCIGRERSQGRRKAARPIGEFPPLNLADGEQV